MCNHWTPVSSVVIQSSFDFRLWCWRAASCRLQSLNQFPFKLFFMMNNWISNNNNKKAWAQMRGGVFPHLEISHSSSSWKPSWPEQSAQPEASYCLQLGASFWVSALRDFIEGRQIKALWSQLGRRDPLPPHHPISEDEEKLWSLMSIVKCSVCSISEPALMYHGHT